MYWLSGLLAPALLLRGSGAVLLREHAAAPVKPTLRGGWPEECLPEEHRLKLERLTDKQEGSAVQANSRPYPETEEPKRGDVFVGQLDGCKKGKGLGFRLEVGRWPAEMKLDVFPMADWNSHAKMFTKPDHNTTGEWVLGIDATKDSSEMFSLKAKAGVIGNLRKKYQFSLDIARPRGTELWGDLVWPAAQGKERYAPSESELEELPFYCTGFMSKKCVDYVPTAQDKVVVFMRHGAAGCQSDGSDPTLNDIGVMQVADRRSDPNLWKMLSSNPREQAEVILVSPLARALQTALMAFKDALPHAKWEVDANLVELGGVGSVIPWQGEKVLKNYSMAALLDQYHTILDLADKDYPSRPYDHRQGHHHHHHDKISFERKEGFDDPWLQNARAAVEAESAAALGADLAASVGVQDGDGPELEMRFARFARSLAARPEKRFIAVSHKHLLKAGTGIGLDQTETTMMALTPDGMWRRVAMPPQCWPGFHI